MKKIVLITLVGLFSVSSFATVKIGYVDMQKAIRTTKAGKSARKSLEKEFNKKKKELEKRERDITKMKEDFEKKSLSLSDDVKAKKQAEFQKQFYDYQKLAAKSQQDISVKERNMTMPIVKKLKEILAGIAKKEKYTMVFEKTEQSVLYAESGVDLTAKVVNAFEKKK